MFGSFMVVAVVFCAPVGAQEPAAAPSPGASLHDRAEAALAMGDDLQAEALFRQAIAADRRLWQAYLGLAHYYLDRRLNCDDAIPNFEAALELAPRVAPVIEPIYQGLMLCYGRDGADTRFLSVAELYIRVLRAAHEHAAARAVRKVRARWLIRLTRYAEAEEALGGLLVEDWADPEAHELRAHVRFYLGRFEDARADYLYIRQTFDTPLINLYLGVALLRMERYAEATEALTLSLQRDGELPDTYRWLAQAWLGQQQWQRAEWSYRRAIEFGGLDDELALSLKNNLAWLLVTRARPGHPSLREALAIALQVVEATHGEVAAYTDTLAEIYLRLGRHDLALQWGRVSLRREPGNPHYAEQLARFQAAADGFPAAGTRLLRRWREP